jgi:hypothetical protein
MGYSMDSRAFTIMPRGMSKTMGLDECAATCMMPQVHHQKLFCHAWHALQRHLPIAAAAAIAVLPAHHGSFVKAIELFDWLQLLWNRVQFVVGLSP